MHRCTLKHSEEEEALTLHEHDTSVPYLVSIPYLPNPMLPSLTPLGGPALGLATTALPRTTRPVPRPAQLNPLRDARRMSEKDYAPRPGGVYYNYSLHPHQQNALDSAAAAA